MGQFTMKKIAVRFVILAGLLNEVTLGPIKYVTEKKTWFEARTYCREHHTDLYSGFFRTQEEWLEARGHPHTGGWIGLHRDANNTWKWPGGNNASVLNWFQNLYDGNESASCVALTKNEWHGMDCDKKLKFYCYETKMVLVRENKTWEEALEHCHSMNKNLARSLTDGDLSVALRICRHSQTEDVWIGLRYLAGRWLAMKNSPQTESRNMRRMPECPAWGHHCGAISTTQQTWINLDCAAKLNFIC